MYIYMDFCREFTCRMCGTCCRNNWLVTVSEKAYQRNAAFFSYNGGQDEFHKAFALCDRQGDPGEYAYIRKKPNGECWFLEGDSLCRLHKTAGHDHLDSVCQLFPRYPMNTTRGVEITLTFSCPAVVDMASRDKTLRVIRSETPPFFIGGQEWVTAVFPEQQPVHNPLRYYFEMENHFIDIMQQRGLPIDDRLAMIQKTALAMDAAGGKETLGQDINDMVRRNYDFLDRYDTAVASTDLTSDILLENFFVNFIFKKPFYILGLTAAVRLLDRFRRELAPSRYRDLKSVRAAIMAIEFQYSHARQSLLAALQANR
ncbi:Hypothetical protein LUCI_0360 [Lucifera butyrica]|uniref:Flagellin N-methylase n=1 Tax=Lucifera butyrica TaxID=1351585 RepID=A0A498R4P6_9FIRM|nr:flagellin lysine-N-methylase [Lucifera butyrica]VBB05153.1 Hypothetical protein LUCI_0360 [Lucifera butyrica]